MPKLNFARFLKARRGASTTEMGILLGLIAIAVIVALVFTGDKIARLFSETDEAIVMDGSGGSNGGAGGDGGSTTPIPNITLSANPSSVNNPDAVTVSWNATNATGVNFTREITGSCAMAGAAEGLFWNTMSGSQGTPWSEGLAGCEVTWCGSALGDPIRTKCVEASYLAFDANPDPLSFPVTMVQPGEEALSNIATVTGIDTTVPADVTNGQVSIRASSEDPATFTNSGHVFNNAIVQLKTTAPTIQGQSKSVILNIGTQSTPWLVKAIAEDTDPDLLSFLPLSGREPGAAVLSNVEIVSGLGGEQPFDVENGEAKINGGAASASGNVNDSDNVQLSATAPVSFDATKTVTFTINGVPTTWSITTRAKDVIPDVLPSFIASLGNNPGVGIVSNAQSITGFDAPVTLSVTNGELSIDGGSSWATSVLASNGASILLRTTAPSASDGLTVLALRSDGTHLTYWNVTTRDFEPDVIAFAPVTVLPSVSVDSIAYAVSGFAGTNTLSVSGGTVSVNGGAFAASAPIQDGDTVVLRTTSSAVNNGTGQVDVTASSEGGILGTWTVYTVDQTPGAIAFTNQTSVALSTAVTSNAVALNGFTGQVTATCSANCTGILKNGAAATPGVTQFAAGDTIAIQMTSSASFGTAKTATVTVGSATSAAWSVTTRAQDTAPSAIAFVTQTGVEPSTTITSNAVVLSNFDGPITATCGAGCVGILKNGTAAVQGSTQFFPGDTIAISMTSAAGFNTAKTASVTVGTATSSAWSVTTRAASTAVAAFDFGANSSDSANGYMYSPSSPTLTGFEAPLSFTLSRTAGTGSFIYQLNGGAWSAAFTTTQTISNVAPGTTIRVAIDPALGATTTIQLSGGSPAASDTWSATETYASCGSTSISWSSCSATSGTGNHNATKTISDNLGGYTGSIGIKCNNGTWQTTSSGSCTYNGGNDR